MNKLDTHFPLDPIEIASDPSTLHHGPVDTSSQAARRLIVLVPPDSDQTAMTHRVWKVASETGMHVLFLGLCKDAAQEPALRRELITMAALIRTGRVCAEANVEIGTNWVETVKQTYQQGDMVVCFAEQQVGILHRPLSQILQASLHVPVYILSGLHRQSMSQSNWLSQALGWTGSLGIIAGSALLQIRITSLPQDWVQTTLLILSVFGEVWLIWAWNSLLS